MFVVTETEVVDLPGERLEAELMTLAAHLQLRDVPVSC